MLQSVLMIGLVLAGIVGGTHMASEVSVRRAASSFPPTGKFVAVEGVRLHYVAAGSGRPVVFLHGAGTSLLDFTMTMFDQAAGEYQVIAFDRPGHGYSEEPRGEIATPQVQARLLRGALRELNIEKPVLVGHSWGGAVALAYAIEYPNDTSGIVLLGTVAYAENYGPIPSFMRLPEVPVVGGTLTSATLLIVGKTMAESMFEGAFRPNSITAAPPGYVRATSALSLRPSQFRANAKQVLHTKSSLTLMEPRYGDISVPTTIVTGGADPMAKPQWHSYPLHDAIPHSKLVVLPGVGHMIAPVAPNAIMEAIRTTFAAEPTGGRPALASAAKQQ